MEARAGFEVVPPVLTAGQGSYTYAVDVKETQLQVNSNTYPASLPPYDRSVQKMQTAAAFS